MATFTITTDTNYNTLSGVANDDNITIDAGAIFTVEESTVDIRQIQCLTFGTLQVNNTSTTNPIFLSIGSTTTTNRRIRMEAGGQMICRGDKIQIGTGTGVAGQVVTLPQDAGLNNCPDLGGLWVDHGDTLRDSTPVLRPYLQVADATNMITLDEVDEVFTQDTGLNQVTFSKAVPLNAPIYMANIVVKLGDSLAVGDNPFTDFSLSGTCDMEWVHWGPDFDLSFGSAKQIRWINCAFAKCLDDLNCTNQILAPELESVITIGGPNTNALTFANSPLLGSHKNCWFDMGRADGNGYTFIASTTSSGYFEKCRFTSHNIASFAVTEAQKSLLYMTNCSNTKVFDCVFMGNTNPIIAIGGSSDCVIDNTKFGHGARTTATQSEDLYCFRASSITNFVISRYYHQDPAVTGGLQPTNDALYLAAGCVNCTFDDVILYAGAGTGGDSIDSPINETGLNSRYNNVLIYGLFDQRMIDFQTASLNAEMSNIRTDQTQTITTSSELGAGCKIDQVTTGRNSNTISTSAVGTGTDCISALFYEWDDTDKTNGRFFMRMSPSIAETEYYTVITQTGSIVFNNNNRLYMNTAGDQIELQSRVHYNIVSANGTIQNGVSTGNFTVEFALRRPEGVYTTYRSFGATNFNTSISELASDAQNRVQIKMRITRDVSNFTDYINQLGFDLNLTGDDYPFSIGKADLTLTGLQPNSEVRVYEGTTELMGVENSGTSFTGEYNVPYSAGEFSDITATIIVHSIGYVPIRLEGVTLGSAGATIPIQQRIDRNYLNP